MGGFGRGLDYMREQAAQAGQWGGAKKLWLTSGEVAKLWFLEEPTNMLVPLLHAVPTPKKGGGTWSKDVLCERRSLQDSGERCRLCMAGATGPWPRTVTLVWVQQVVHPSPPTKGEPWAPVTRPGVVDPATGRQLTFYREEVGDTRLFIMKGKIVDQVAAEYAGVKDAFAEEAAVGGQTLLNRPFTFTRTGSGAQVQEILTALAPAPPPAAAVEARAQLAGIEELILAEFGDGKRQLRPAVTGSADDYLPVGAAVGQAVAPALGDDELVSF